MEVAGLNLGFRIGAATLLRGVDLVLRPGEVLGLIGPNGAGKTTLLKLLAGLETPETGSVTYDGQTLAEIGPRALARRLAYLPQRATVEWPVTVANLIALGRLPHRAMWGDLDAEDRRAIDRALQRTGMQAFSHRSAGTLSGGERMRALLGRLLAVEAETLLADEPVAALDPHYQLQFMDLFRELGAEGCSVVLVLHDLALAARYCDRIVLLDEGCVVSSGAPAEVLTGSVLERVYGVQTVSGSKDGQLYVLPWQRTAEDDP